MDLRFFGFLQHIRRCAQIIYRMGRNDVIHIFSHIDADGISSAIILAKLLTSLNKPFILNFVPQIVPNEFMQQWQNIKPRYAIFADLGTSIPYKIMSKTNSIAIGIILDHHISHEIEDNDPRIFVVNPRFFNIDGGSEISSSGVAYLVSNMYSRMIPEIKKFAKYAIVGAIGDSQDIGWHRSLIGLNRAILEDGQKRGVVTEQEDLLLIGKGIKPLYRLLAEVYHIEIPSITGSYDGAANFLVKNGLLRSDDDIENIYLDDLPKNKRDLLRRRLIELLMVNYPGKYTIESLEDLLTGKIYILRDEKIRLLRYARDVAILFNACGKLRRPQLAFSIAFSGRKEKIAEKMIQIYDRYRAIISNILKQLDSKIEYRNGVAIYDGRGEITEELASTIASIIAASKTTNAHMVIVFTDSIGGNVKVSARRTTEGKINDVERIIRDAISRLTGATGGGHKEAAGAYIKSEDVDKFLDTVCKSVGET